MSCTEGWSYGIAMNSVVINLVKSSLITRWKNSGHDGIWTGDYNGNPTTVTFGVNKSQLVIDSDSANTLQATVPFSGQSTVSGVMVSFSGNFVVNISLDNLSITQSWIADNSEWQAYLNLSSGVFELVSVTISTALPTSYSATIQTAMTDALQDALDNFIAESPISLGTHESYPASNGDGKVSPEVAQAMGPTLIQFITLNISSSTPLLVALAMVGNETAPTGDWQSSLESAGTFNLQDSSNTTLAVGDNTLWNLIADYGPPSTETESLFFKYGVGGNDPSVLTINIKPGDTSSLLQAAQDFDWSGVCQLTLPDNQLQINVTVNGGYTASYQFGLAIAVVQNPDGSASLEKTFTSEGSVVTFNPSATGPTAVISTISGLVVLLQFVEALLLAIAAIIWYSVLYTILEKIPGKVATAINDNINKVPKSIGGSAISLQSFSFNDGVIVGLEVRSLRDHDA